MCFHLSKDKLGCDYTLSDKPFVVDNGQNLFPIPDPKTGKKLTRDEVVAESIVAPAYSVAKIKAFMLKICKRYGKCSDGIGKWEREK